MSPSHSQKDRNRRYRYYVSQATLKYEGQQAGSVTRVSAPAIEGVVIREFLALVQDGTRILDLIQSRSEDLPSQASVIDKGHECAKSWPEMSPPSQINILTSALRKVEIGRERVRITFSISGVLHILGAAFVPDPDIVDDYVIDLSINFRRCGIESKLLVTGRATEAPHQSVVHAIQQALHHALLWNQALITGEARSMSALARKHGVTQRYIAHLIQLAWLSPNIMQAIFRAQMPATLSLERLKKGFPLDWDKQWQELGFSSCSETPIRTS
ncbi:MAG: hypothetical protein WBM41_11210 [Arenicellales bacterium]